MHILAFILMFIIGSIGAAFRGDFSGISAIGFVIECIGIIFFVGTITSGFCIEGSGKMCAIGALMLISGLVLAALD